MEDLLQMISFYSIQGSPKQEGSFTCTPNPTLTPRKTLKFLSNREQSSTQVPFYINLLALTFCFFLGACGGNSDSGSSNSNSSSEKREEVLSEKECKVENGVSELRTGECKVVACSEGYYKPFYEDICVKTSIAIAAGSWHICVILDDGDTSNGGPVKCWGQIKSSSSRYIDALRIDVDSKPNLGTKQDGSLYTATTIAAGSMHACVILDDDGDTSNGGPVKCWGTRVVWSPQESIVNVDSIPNLGGQTATHIAAGDGHTCAILADKSVKCWGTNASGQTGGGTPNLGTKQDGSLYTATTIAAGDSHTCVILDDDGNTANGGPIKCWGERQNKNGYVNVDSIPNLGSQTATHIAAGDGHTCAILADKSVKCWGYNVYGQTGGGTPNLGTKQDGSLYTATTIAAGAYHTCVILDDDGNTTNGGPIKCWGLTFVAGLLQDTSFNLGAKQDGFAYTATAISMKNYICAILDDDGNTSNGGPVKCTSSHVQRDKYLKQFSL